MQEVGDKEFIILEDFLDEQHPPHDSGPPLRFKYPANITWEEINKFPCLGPDKDEGICYELFGRPVRNYFVFGDSGLWGRYVANDYYDDDIDFSGFAFDIIGYKPQYRALFREKIKISEYDKKRVLKWLPPNYRTRVDF